jgi:hypothetical protein
LHFFRKLFICSSINLIIFFFWCLIFWALYIFWVLILYPMNNLQRSISTQSVDFLWTLVVVSLAVQKLFNLVQSHVSILIIFWAIRGVLRKALPMTPSSYWPSVFLQQFDSFRPYTKIFDPFRTGCTGWETGLVSVFYMWISSFPNSIG